MKLTIAIPTYNRAKRLEKSLVDLCSEINSASFKADVAVYVSNNGSEDDTAVVIEKSSKLFIENGIPFTSNKNESNQGFDANVLACYAGCDSEYVWFLSDDDNIIPGAIDAIMCDINQYHPSVAYYNHDQAPYEKSQPYIEEYKYFDRVSFGNIISLQKIIKWPKLTSLVIKKCDAGLQVRNENSGFAHITLALQCALRLGGILHSPVFTACPDDDYMDHVDFVPYIGNNMAIPLQWVLTTNNRMSLYDPLAPSHIDPLISSLIWLGSYYRGLMMLTVSLKGKLWKTVKYEIKCGFLKRCVDRKSVLAMLKFLAILVYFVFIKALTGKDEVDPSR